MYVLILKGRVFMENIISYGFNEIVETNNVTIELYERFISFIDAKPRTIETYRKAIKQFFLYMQDNNIKAPCRQDIINYRDMLAADRKPSTVQTYLTAVKLFFKWLEQEGVYKNVTVNVKGVKINKGHKKDYLTSNQSKCLLKGIDRATIKGKRDYAMILLMLTAGLRTIEVSRANIEDMQLKGDSMVLYIQGKGKDEKSDYVKIAPQVEKAIREYLKARKPVNKNDALFISTSNNKSDRLTTRSIRGVVKEHLTAAGYESDRLTAHSLRHTAGTLNILNGGTLDETQQLLRHSNINTTMIYLHNLERDKNNSESRIADAIFGD